MKKHFWLLYLIGTLLVSCKNEVKPGLASQNEEQSSEGNAVEEGVAAEIDLEKVMGTMGDLVDAATENAQDEGMFKNGQLNIEYLKSDAGKPMRKVFAEMAEVTEEEVDLVLSLPTKNTACSVTQHRIYMDQASDPKIQAYIDSGRASEGFMDLIIEYRESATKFEEDLLKRTKNAKNKFLARNNSWIGLADDTLENGYLDAANEMVYLPLGKLSFADSVIEFKPGKLDGRTPELSLGPPESLAPDAYTDCAVLGLGGVLTLFFEDNAIIDVNGPDIYVFELGATEPTNLEISKDGQNWITVGQIKGGTASVDIRNHIENGEVFHYVRFTDLQTNSTQPGADIDAVAAIGGALRMNLNSAVLFETGKHELKKEGILAIKALADQMKNLQKGTITVEGHTDDVGSDTTNKTLSQKRAASVAAELKKAIDRPAFKWKELGYGETNPLVANDTDENRQKNRRVEILVTPY